MKRFVVGAILVVLLPSLAEALPAVQRYVSPSWPILVDTDGNGMPTVDGDGTIVPEFDGRDMMTIPNPWEDCGPATHNVVQLTHPPSVILVPPFTGGRRFRENQTETLEADEIIGGRPTHFAMEVEKPGFPMKSGEGSMVDANGDGIYDGIAGEGTGGIDFHLNLIFEDVDGDGWGDYTSIPWSQASALGVDMQDDCEVAGGDPQVWVPMADTDGDGLPDAIALDLNDDGQADPQFLLGPLIGPVRAGVPIPTLSEWSGLLAALGLALAAWMQIRSHGLGA